MKALLDEHLSPRLAVLLRRRGHDVIAVAERSELLAASDREILDTATSEGRAVVTSNVKDFRPLAAERLARGGTHPGLILLPSSRTRRRDSINALAVAIASVLEANPDGLESAERWLPPL